MSTAVRTFGKQEIANLTKVIESGNFAHHKGGFIDRFEQEFAEDYDVKHAIAGASAMVLMHAIPGAIGAGAGDEIICDPVVQFHGIACLHGNVVPVWADVRKDDFLLDPEAGRAAHDQYTDLQTAVLDIVATLQPVGPDRVAKELANKGMKVSPAEVLEIMEGLRSAFPRKLSHAGPERFAYHDLSR